MIDHLSLTATRHQAYIPPVAVNPATETGISNARGESRNRNVCGFFHARPTLNGGPFEGAVKKLTGPRARYSHLVRATSPLGIGVAAFNKTKDARMTTTLEARDARTVARALAILESAFSHPDRSTLDNPNTAKEYAQLRLGGLDREQMIAMWLDSQHRLIQVEILSTGTLTQTTVYPREVVRSALHFGASSVIFAHNHPSGNSTPSRADLALTSTLIAALSLIDVKTLDHLIVTASNARSLAAMGEM